MNRREIDGLSWRMSEVYADCVDKILVNLARHFQFIKDGEPISNAWNYQIRKLAEMDAVTQETAQIILNTLGGADETLQGLLIESIQNGLKDAEPTLRRAAEKGLLKGPISQIAPNQMQAFRAYYKQSADKLNLVNTVMLDSTQNAYRATVSDISSKIDTTQGILNTSTGEVITGVNSFNKVQRDAVRRMVDNGLTGFIDHGGHHWSPEAYVAMDMRTTMSNTARAAVFEQADEFGVELYQVSHHNGARPLCYPWQGKVISRNGWTGEVQDDEGNPVQVHSEDEIESFQYGGGLFGVNCGHYPIPFIPGFSRIRPPEQDEKANAKEYAESQQQRALERNVRNEKRELEVMRAQGADKADIDAQKTRVKEANADIDQFCKDTGRARRPERTATPINAPFPDKNTYDVSEFDRTKKDEIEQFFSGKTQNTTQGVQTPPVPEQKAEPAMQTSIEPVQPASTATFTPAKTIEEAEEFAKTFTDTNHWGSYGVSYQGVSVETANLVNQKLSEFTNTYNVDKISGIVAPAGNTKLGKHIEGAHAGYNSINHSMVINRKTAKTPAITAKALKTEKDFVTDYLKDPSKYPGVAQKKYLKKLLDASATSGRATVPDTLGEVIDHELGHALQKGVMNSPNFGIIEKNWGTWGAKISGYAQENINEYIAESFCAWRKGEAIDPELIKAFEWLKR